MAKREKQAGKIEKPVKAWCSAFDRESKMAMAHLRGEALTADGAGTLYACCNPVWIAHRDQYVPVPTRGSFVVVNGKIQRAKPKRRGKR